MGGTPTGATAQASQFDGQNAVPGYTLFQGKDGQSYYLKGEGLSDSVIASKVAALRGASQPISKYNPKPGAGAANLADPDNPISSGDEGSQPVDAMMSPQSQREATTRGAAIGVGGLATAAAIPAAAALAAPRAIGQAAVGTGILDASGQEITRLVTQYGPSAVKQVLMHPFVQSALKGLAIGGGSLLSGTAGYKILKSLGVIGHD